MIWFIVLFIELVGWIIAGKLLHEQGFVYWWLLAIFWPWMLLLWICD